MSNSSPDVTGADPLKAPLLHGTTQERMKTMQWPKLPAESLLYLPHDWHRAVTAADAADEDPICSIQFDSEHKLLKVVDNGGNVLDYMNPKDIIGCELEVKLFDPSSGHEIKTTFQNAFLQRKDDEDNADDEDKIVVAKKELILPTCNIFEPLEANTEGIFHCTSLGGTSIPLDAQATAVLNIYSYPKYDPAFSSFAVRCGFASAKDGPNPKISETNPEQLGHRQPRHRKFQVAPAEDFGPISALVRAIRQVSGLAAKPQRKCLVLVNPKSGTGKGLNVYETIVKEVLEQAGMQLELCVTNHAGHASERVQNDSTLPDVFDGIITIGGDGVMHEVLQGIQARSDAAEILSKFKFGVIGAGTGNGFAKSLTFASEEKHTFLESAFLIAKGQARKVDISQYQTNTKSYTSFLTYAWGIIADMDVESEVIRFVGALRYDLWGAWRVAFLRKYQARFSYLPATERVLQQGNYGDRMPDLDDPVPEDWIVEEDSYILFWASHVTHAAINTFHCPPSEMHDGVFQVLVVRGNCSRFKMASILLGLESGGHAAHEKAEFIECVAYRLEPITTGSCNDLDGEVVEAGPIQGYVRPGALGVYCLDP